MGKKLAVIAGLTRNTTKPLLSFPLKQESTKTLSESEFTGFKDKLDIVILSEAKDPSLFNYKY